MPEAVSSPEIVDAAGSDEVDPGAAVARALAHLVETGEIRMSRGPALSPRPAPVPTDEALRLLKDPHWRGWGREENEERLFFANATAANMWNDEA